MLSSGIRAVAPSAINRVLASLAVALAACDPGWTYQVPGATAVQENGLWFVLPGPASTALRINATVFAMGFSTAVHITNSSAEILNVAPELVIAKDRHGVPLERNDSTPFLWCAEQFTSVTVSLRQNETCVLNTSFTVSPDPKKLRDVTLEFSGLSRAGRPIPLVVPLTILERER